MEHLYAPWRGGYTAQSKREHIPEAECVFCKQEKEHNDQKYFIIKRLEHNFVMLNRHPYNAGHLLILPRAHVPSLDQMSLDARSEMMELVNTSIVIVQNTLQTEGFNVGLNLGKAGGASIPSHIHMHVLPRYPGDTNFLPLLAQTKQISFDLNEIYKKILAAFQKLS